FFFFVFFFSCRRRHTISKRDWSSDVCSSDLLGFFQSFGNNGSKERTQAGIEYFGEKSAAADAEVIALAIHALRDLGDYKFKIEKIGRASCRERAKIKIVERR